MLNDQKMELEKTMVTLTLVCSFSISVTAFKIIKYIFILKEGVTLHFNKPEFSVTKYMLCAIFFLIWSSGSEQKTKSVKSFRTDRQTDDRRTKCDQNSSIEISVQMNEQLLTVNTAYKPLATKSLKFSLNNLL